MPQHPETTSPILDLLWQCTTTEMQMYAGNSTAYLEAATELSELDVPDEIAPDPRFPQNMTQEFVTEQVAAVLYLAANYLIEVHRDGEAIPLLERTLQLVPKHVDAHRELAVALSVTNRNEEALLHYQTYAELRPTDPLGFCGSGDCLIALGRGHEGRAAYNMAESLAPDNPLVLKRLELLRRMGLEK